LSSRLCVGVLNFSEVVTRFEGIKVGVEERNFLLTCYLMLYYVIWNGMSKIRFYTTPEVLRLLKVSRMTLYRWIRQELVKQPKRNARRRMYWNSKDLQQLRKFVKDRYTPK